MLPDAIVGRGMVHDGRCQPAAILPSFLGVVFIAGIICSPSTSHISSSIGRTMEVLVHGGVQKKMKGVVCTCGIDMAVQLVALSGASVHLIVYFCIF